MQEAAPAGRVVAVLRTGATVPADGPCPLEPGPIAVRIVLDGTPVGDLPPGARLRIGGEALVEVQGPEEPDAAGMGGLIELGGASPVPAAVLEGGLVTAGAPVTLEAVAVPLTDVLDLHSFRPEDTHQVVAEYLGEARRAGFEEVRIVHGRGRGVQRAIVRRLLGANPGVVGFTDAPPGRGGWGATIVHLRQPGDAPSA